MQHMRIHSNNGLLHTHTGMRLLWHQLLWWSYWRARMYKQRKMSFRLMVDMSLQHILCRRSSLHWRCIVPLDSLYNCFFQYRFDTGRPDNWYKWRHRLLHRYQPHMSYRHFGTFVLQNCCVCPLDKPYDCRWNNNIPFHTFCRLCRFCNNQFHRHHCMFVPLVSGHILHPLSNSWCHNLDSLHRSCLLRNGNYLLRQHKVLDMGNCIVRL